MILLLHRRKRENEKEKGNTDLACAETLLTGNSNAKVGHIFLSIRNITNREEGMIITTGVSVEGYSIIDYFGIISGECALGTGFFSSVGAGVADFLGRSSTAYSDKLMEAKDQALRGLERNASRIRANAVIGVNLSYTTFTSDIMGVIATGTAVTIQKNNAKGALKDATYENKNITVEDPSLDGNIDLHKVLLSKETKSNKLYLAVGGIIKSGRNIEGLLLDISLLTPFKRAKYQSQIEFFEIKKNGKLFTTNYVQIGDSLDDEHISSADVKMINLIADGRLAYGVK